LIVSGFWIGKILHSSQPFLNKTDADSEYSIDKANIRNFLKWLSMANKYFKKHGAFRGTFKEERIAELGLFKDTRPMFFNPFPSFLASWSALWHFGTRKLFSEKYVVLVLERMKRHPSDFAQILFRTLASEKRILFASRWATLQDPSENKGKMSRHFYMRMRHTGMFVGSCSDKAQVEDRIAIIPGLSLPLILRPREDGYQVIGPAHIAVLRDYLRIYFKGKSDPKWEAIVLY
jgi:hypothetical protein